MKLWNFLNGKKTNIGAACLFLSLMITDLVIGKLNYDPLWIKDCVIIFNWFGGIMTGSGLTHKYIKFKKNGTNANTNGDINDGN